MTAPSEREQMDNREAAPQKRALPLSRHCEGRLRPVAIRSSRSPVILSERQRAEGSFPVFQSLPLGGDFAEAPPRRQKLYIPRRAARGTSRPFRSASSSHSKHFVGLPREPHMMKRGEIKEVSRRPGAQAAGHRLTRRGQVPSGCEADEG